MQHNYSTLRITEINSIIAVITLNRPDVLNAINLDMMNDLLHLWQNIVTTSYRCVILTGQGKAFCAGADLKARHNLDLDTWMNQHAVLQQAMLAMVDCPIPIIAAVNGYAFGGGLELAMASDFIYAVDTSIFAQSEVKVGIIPGAMGTQNLPRAAGLRRAKELCFTAQSFTAAEALDWGIVNRICTPTQLLAEATATAQLIAANAPLAIRQAKRALNKALDSELKEGYAFEVEVYNSILPSNDRIEGIAAFNEKRKPEFTGS